MNTILGFKLGRRLIAAAALADEQFVFSDQHYVTPRPASRDANMARYFERLLDQVKPALVFYYTPATARGTTKQLVTLLEQAAAARGIPVRGLTKSELMDHFGFTPVRTRRELRELLAHLWPVLEDGKDIRHAVLAEAAAAAMNGEVQRQLEAP
jgi:hypothetical protein